MYNLTRGERFKDARTVHNQYGSQSMDEVYAATGVSASMIKDLEDDQKGRSVGYDKIAALAKHYGVSSDYLLGLSPYPTTNKDLEFVCNYTGLNEKSVKYLRSLLEIYNGPIEPSQAPKEAKRWLKGPEYYEKYYEDILHDCYSDKDYPHRESADSYGVVDESNFKAFAKALTENHKRNLERVYNEEIEAYKANIIVPIVTLNAILSCDQQKKILTDLAYFIQIDNLKEDVSKTMVKVNIREDDGDPRVFSELPVEAIAWGYLRRAEKSLSELHSEFTKKGSRLQCSVSTRSTVAQELRKNSIPGYDEEK